MNEKKKKYTRDEVINWIAGDWAETLINGGSVAEAMIEGRKGLREYSNDELVIEWAERNEGEEIEIVGKDERQLEYQPGERVGVTTIEKIIEVVTERIRECDDMDELLDICGKISGADLYKAEEIYAATGDETLKKYDGTDMILVDNDMERNYMGMFKDIVEVA